MTGGVAPSELHHEEKHFISVHLRRPLIQNEPPFTFGQLTALVKMSDVAMTDEYGIAIMFIFTWFFFRLLPPFPTLSGISALGETKRNVFF